MKSVDAEVVEEKELCSHHILHRHDREGHGILFPCDGVDRGGATGAIAPPGDIGTDDEKLVTVQGPAWTDELLPPAPARIDLQTMQRMA